MHERLYPTTMNNTCDLGPETGEHVDYFLDFIKKQIGIMHLHNIHHPWLPDDEISMTRLTYAIHELASESGKVAPIESYMEYVLAHSIETFSSKEHNHTKSREEIKAFIGHGITVLHELNPEKAHHYQTRIDKDISHSSSLSP